MSRSTELPVIHLPDPKNTNEFIGVIKNKSVRCYGKARKYPVGSTTPTWVDYDQTFVIGDIVEYHSYNLSYTGPIVAIGDKTVTIRKGSHPDAKTARLSLHDFNWRNKDFDLAATRKRNSEWSD